MKRGISFILALATFFSFAFCFPFVSAESGEELPSLAAIYKDYFLIGNVFSPNNIPGSRFEFMKRHFNVLTAENAMKPDAMQGTQGVFSFGRVDPAVYLILEEGIKIHGHTLAWHSQSPSFLNSGVTREQAEQNMRDHVMNVAGHFSGKVISWDVLNEGMNDNPTNPDDWRASLRKTPWLNSFAEGGGDGSDYIYELFKIAREADPHAILYYNDYNLDNRNKALAVYNMVKELNAAYSAEGNDRLLIEGVGMQGHYNLNTSIDEVEKSILLFKELGVEVSFTELDIIVSGAGREGLGRDDELRQAFVYAELFKMFKKHSDVIARVTFWGLNDALSWRGSQYPLIFNGDFSPKLSFFAVADPEGFLAEHDISNIERTRRLTGQAAMGTPVIDGEVDDIWTTTKPFQVDQMLQAWQTAGGTARVMWDNENLYVLVQVNDTRLDRSSSAAHERDSVEIFIDELNCKSGAYKDDDRHIRVCYGGVATYGTNGLPDGFESAVSVIDTFYTVEMKIPFTAVSPEEGLVIGFDVQINDARTGTRIGIAKWNDWTDNSSEDTTNWGEIKLVTEITDEPEPEVLSINENNESYENDENDENTEENQNENARENPGENPNENSDINQNEVSESEAADNNDDNNLSPPPVVILIAVLILAAGVIAGLIIKKRKPQ